jgi:hypothetical protein
MKNKSLKCIAVLSILMLLQTDCNPQSNDKLAQAKNLEQKAAFYRKEGEVDSAIAYYNKSLIVYKDLANQTEATKGTLYIFKIAQINLFIGLRYDSINNFDNALKYVLESLQWAKRLNHPILRLIDEGEIGRLYAKSGALKKNDSDEQLNLYKEGLKYTLACCWAMDSLGWDIPGNFKDNKMALDCYALAHLSFKKIGDTSREQFYQKKYYDLYTKLYGHAPVN